MEVSSGIGLVLLTILISIIGYLLAKRDDAQESKIIQLRNDKQRAVVGVRTELQAMLVAQRLSFEDKTKAFDATIRDLYLKHQTDVEKLEALQREVDREHYNKAELDSKLAELKSTFKIGFTSLSEQLSRLSKHLIEHMQNEKIK